uniref:JAB domain-containing protein n=1 Tax=Desulfobacca acetoxidans TaxID=60893 RepID=A0A7C3Z2V7_9BACT
MRFKALKDLERRVPLEIALTSRPTQILMTDYARAKAFLVSDLVRQVHGAAYEWYGFTLAERQKPEVIVDVGLPDNDENQENYTRLSPERIVAYQETLPAGLVINGWLHSHGALAYREFSAVDGENQATVLDYVTSALMAPVARKEVVIRDLALRILGEDDALDQALGALADDGAPGAAPASVILVTDAPVSRARLFETVYGGFCFAVVIGDEGWTKQEIHYKTRGLLTGETQVSYQEADLILVKTGKSLTLSDREALELEVKERLRPVTYTLEKLERG